MFFALSLAFAAQAGFPAASDAAQTTASSTPGTYEVVPLDERDDGVPLPIAPVYRTTPAGDVLESPAAGDPFFLGFAALKYYPPAAEQVDPELLAGLRSLYDDGRPAQETYAFVMFGKRITAERLEVLRDLGARVLEFHPHYCMKVALAPSAIDTVASQDFVRWIGVPRATQKLHPGLAEAFANTPAGELLEVYIDLFDSDLCAASSSRSAGTFEYGGPDGVHVLDDDSQGPRVWMSNGWQQRALEQLGIDVFEYVDSIHAFRARIAPSQVEALVALDFVQFVEPELTPTLGHDESMSMVLADGARVSYDGNTNLAAVAGQADSGIDYSHLGIAGYYWWASNLSGSAEATTDDVCGHGTHVAGTIHGGGAVDPSYEGAADGLGWGATGRYFNTKIFYGGGCSFGGSSMATILATTHSAVTDGSGNVTPRPHAINHSWGSSSPAGGSLGSEADCRTIDNDVYVYDQLQVIIAHNWGPGAGTVSVQGSSKNAFTVGGVADYSVGGADPGEMYNASGRGPTADLRWKPNIVAPATSIRSAQAGTASGYVNKTGTSMAGPHVTGIAAQLTDHFSFLRHNPTTLGALIMASAMTKDDQLLTTPSTLTTSHLNNYGAGRIEAYKAHFGVGGLHFWGWDQGTTTGTYVDVPVSAGATRIAVCMYYHEVAASAGASAALVNDLDLWIDSPTGGISATTNSGEYSAQQSPRDNTEIRLVNNPVAGTWRVKVHPDSATSTSHVGIAVLIHYQDTTPDGSLNVTTSKTAIKPGENVDITAAAYNPGYIASAVYLDSTSTGDLLTGSTTTLEDGAVTDLLGNHQAGRDVLLGDIKPGDTRSAKWTTHWNSEGFKSFSVNARSDNWVDKSDAVSIVVDGTPPPLPTALTSSTHTTGVWSNNPNLTISWTQPSDGLSGVAGYGEYFAGAPGLPSAVQDIIALPATRNLTLTTLGASYYSLRPVDRSGNWNAGYASFGPMLFDDVQPNYVTGLMSSNHAVGSYSCSTAITMQWDPASDAGPSGMAGFSYHWDHLPVATPDTTLELGPSAVSAAAVLPPDAQPWYFHIRPYDNAGNGQNQFNAGPYYIVSSTPTTYCTGKANSIGCVPAISSSGSVSLNAGNLTVACTNVLNQQNGLMIWGGVPLASPFQGGTLCVASPVVRTPTISSGGPAAGNSCTGSYAFTFTAAYTSLAGIAPGDTLYCQWWMRDPASASTTGLSNALRVTVCE